jgi:hypothetical protein
MATYSTRIFVKVDSGELMDKLRALEISDLGKGYYSAKEVFSSGSVESYYSDTESALNESDIQTLVERVVGVIKDHGTILADTFSYDYDPMPEVCFYNGAEIMSKLLDIDGEEFQTTVDIKNVSEWINFVENAEDLSEEY